MIALPKPADFFAWDVRAGVAPSKKNAAVKREFKSNFFQSSAVAKVATIAPRKLRRRALVISNSSSTSVKLSANDLEEAKLAVKELVQNTHSNPILIRLGWHDAGTYNKDIKEWPKCGGANGSIRFTKEMGHAANAGLQGALKLLDPIKDKFPAISYADLFQLASVTAIELAGGPKIPMRYGRVDTTTPEECPEEGMLPDAGAPSPAEHLRKVFYRMGFNDKEIVALSGAHTLGRARPNRSGWGKDETKYTKDGPGLPGGQSWTVHWLKFDNSYFREVKEKRDAELLVLPTDAALFEDPSFKVYAEKYAEDQETFFKDYAEAHAKLSELGAKFDPPEGITLEAAPQKFVAAEYSTPKKELSDSMKQKIRAEYLGLGGSPEQPLKTNYFLNIIVIIAVLAILTWLFGGF
ncbi:probable L-ascorbate peroxidase 6, chloroplastic/mitochondrial [Selaginella moellendorffii]|uniref:probable L-ascorbate peroxidase 6, chloroplastic/mitochondrial n=1 Tax=Selaginella moellendorffii TaxID=88036 RepID=UPI000D1C793A|nr:probable L-ascorbate peroxidase 6, chloroplastic/mitochondrial [Selaginella moellendorffii]|eukprot:XP_024538691.1 probable L-ascorbate peroxidase 6, chloroplastic/mitochondrial [Selaginella moellendorffii]